MMKFFIGSIAIILLAGCATQDQRVVIAEQQQHPAIALFLNYETAVAEADSFNDVIKDFFNPALHSTILRSQGWYRLAYSASYQGLKNGRCESIELLRQGPNFALLSCKGPYQFKSALGLATDETMQIRVNMKQINGQWYFYKGALTHTMAGGRYPDRNIGLKFK